MKKLIEMLKALLKDKRGEAGLALDTGFYKATHLKYEKIANWLNKEKKLLDFMCLEITTTIPKIKMASLGALLSIPTGFLNSAVYLLSAGKVLDCGDRVISRISNNYHARERRYDRVLNKAIKRKQVSEICVFIDPKENKKEKEFEYD